MCEGCGPKQPYFGLPAEGRKRWCTDCAVAEGSGAVRLGKQKQCEGCGLKRAIFGLPDAERKCRWCDGCAQAHRGAVNLSTHPRPNQPRAARPPKKRRREALAQGKTAAAANRETRNADGSGNAGRGLCHENPPLPKLRPCHLTFVGRFCV